MVYRVVNYFSVHVSVLVPSLSVKELLRQWALAEAFEDLVYVVMSVVLGSALPPVGVNVETQVQTRSFLHEAKDVADRTAINNTTFFIFIFFSLLIRERRYENKKRELRKIVCQQHFSMFYCSSST